MHSIASELSWPAGFDMTGLLEDKSLQTVAFKPRRNHVEFTVTTWAPGSGDRFQGCIQQAHQGLRNLIVVQLPTVALVTTVLLLQWMSPRFVIQKIRYRKEFRCRSSRSISVIDPRLVAVTPDTASLTPGQSRQKHIIPYSLKSLNGNGETFSQGELHGHQPAMSMMYW